MPIRVFLIRVYKFFLETIGRTQNDRTYGTRSAAVNPNQMTLSALRQKSYLRRA